MTRSYDNWGRLVEATLKREELRRLAFAPSINSASFTTSTTTTTTTTTPAAAKDASETSPTCVQVNSFAKSTQLAYSVIRAADAATSSNVECLELKSKAQKLARILHQAARASNQLYDRPARRIVHYTEDVLDKAVSLLLKHRGLNFKRLFTTIDPADFTKISMQLSNSISNVSWLIRGDDYLLLPPIASDEPFLYRIWEPIATLYAGSDDEQCDATASLVNWARDGDLYRKLIIEEGGLQPLLRLLKEGKLQAQMNAVKVIELLAKDGGNLRDMIDAGVCSTLAQILQEGPTKLQPTVAWALSELTSNGDIFQHHFRPQDIVGLLVTHLKSETLQDRSKYDVSNPGKGGRISARDCGMEMAAATLWHLVRADSNIYHSITKSTTLFCFAVVLEKGPKVAQYYCTLTLMEVTAAAERDAELRTRSGFKLNSPACNAILDQLYRIVDEAEQTELLVPCIKTIGNLATTIRASETGMIGPLVRLLEEPQESKVCREACVALMKYACPGNFLSMDRSKAIIGAGGVKVLVVLVYFGEQMVQKPALVLLCYVALNAPHNAQLAEAEVLAVLEWASKQPLLIQDKDVKELQKQAKSAIEHHQSRGSKELELR